VQCEKRLTVTTQPATFHPLIALRLLRLFPLAFSFIELVKKHFTIALSALTHSTAKPASTDINAITTDKIVFEALIFFGGITVPI